MSWITTIERSYECGPLGEIDFTIDVSYTPPGKRGNPLEYSEIEVLDVHATISNTLLKVDTDFNQEELQLLQEVVEDKYRDKIRDDYGDRVDRAYDRWKEAQLYKEVE